MAIFQKDRKVFILAVLVVFIGMVTAGGCSRDNQGNDYLMRVQDISISLIEYKQAVETAREEAYPGEREIDIEALNDLRIRVLNQLSEEMMIIAFAKANGITVSETELEKAVEEIKADYPDNTFEETLLENAVSFNYWKEKLANRLLINKVIDRELVEKVQITTDDVADYYKTQYTDGGAADEDSDAINKKIVRHLRQQKAEISYKEWIETLRRTYPVDINQKLWEKVTENRR